MPLAPTAAKIVPPLRLMVAVSVNGFTTPMVWLPWMFHCTAPPFNTAPLANVSPLLNFTVVPVDMSMVSPGFTPIVTLSRVPPLETSLVPSPLTKTAFFNVPVSAPSPPVPKVPPLARSTTAPAQSKLPDRLRVVPALRIKWPPVIAVPVEPPPRSSEPTCKLTSPVLVQALAGLIVIAAPLMTTLPGLSKFVDAILTVPALAFRVPPAALVKVVVENVSDAPLALITPLLTSVAAFELLKPIVPLALSVIPRPIVYVPVAPTAAKIVPPVRVIVAVSVSGFTTPMVWLPWIFHCADPPFNTAPLAKVRPLLNFTTVLVDMSMLSPGLTPIVTPSSVPELITSLFGLTRSLLISTAPLIVPLLETLLSPPALNCPLLPMSSVPPPMSKRPAITIAPPPRTTRAAAMSAAPKLLPKLSVPL